MATNWNNIQSFGHGLALFGVGAAQGVLVVACPGAIPLIVGGGTFATSVVNQGFINGFNNINYEQAAFEGIVSGGIATATGALMKMPGVSKFLDKITGNIKSPLLRNVLNGQIVGTTTGATVGAGMAAYNGEDIGVGAWNGAKMGYFTGTLSGFGNAVTESYHFKTNIFTGNQSLKTGLSNYNFTADTNGDNVTLYRGMTGHEGGNRELWMTTDKGYAETYSKTGEVVEISMPRSTLFQMEQHGVATPFKGINVGGSSFVEYRFQPSVSNQILNNYNIIP